MFVNRKQEICNCDGICAIDYESQVLSKKEGIMEGCLGDSKCGGCSCNSSIEESEMIKGYINIYDVGGLYQAMSAVFDTEERAMKTGEFVKGYVGTVFISLPMKGIYCDKI